MVFFMKIMPGFIATELVILTFDSVNEMILLINKNAISLWKHAYTCHNTKFGTFSISLIMEHFLIFLSLQKPVNRLLPYFILFLYVEGKDGEVILISEHHKFLFETYLIIGERTEGRGGGAGASTCPFSILFTISFHHLFLGCLFLAPFQYWIIA